MLHCITSCIACYKRVAVRVALHVALSCCIALCVALHVANSSMAGSKAKENGGRMMSVSGCKDDDGGSLHQKASFAFTGY